MKKLMDAMDGYKTYLTAGMVAGLTFARIVGWVSNQTYQTVMGLLVAFGLYGVRDGIRKVENNKK